MKDKINKEDISSVTGGAAEALRELTDENELNAALKERNIRMNDADLAREALKQPIQQAPLTAGSSCSSCPKRRNSVTVLQ